jgi:hypothetical protein
MAIQHQLLQAVFRAPSASFSAGDDDMTLSLVHEYGIAPDQCAAVKRLFKAPLAELRSAISKARAYHREHTFQGIGPTRLLVTGEQESYSAGMNAYITQINEVASRFITDYPLHLEAEKALKGTAFRADDYPNQGKLAELFQASCVLMPLPEPGDFFKSLAGDHAEKLKKEYETALKNTEENVRKQVMGRMLKLIAETAESLASDGPIVDNENKKGPLAKLREYLDRAPTLNITGDPQITALIEECRGKLDVSTEALRGSEFYRKKTASAAHEIASKFGQLGVRKLATTTPAASTEEPHPVAA